MDRLDEIKNVLSLIGWVLHAADPNVCIAEDLSR